MAKFLLERYNRNCPKEDGWFSGLAKRARGGKPVWVKSANGDGIPFGLVPGMWFTADIKEEADEYKGRQSFVLENIELGSALTEQSVEKFLSISEAFAEIRSSRKRRELAYAFGADFESIVSMDVDEVLQKVSDWVKSSYYSHRTVREKDVRIVQKALMEGALRHLIKRFFPSLDARHLGAIRKEAKQDESLLRSVSGVENGRDAAQKAVKWLFEHPYMLCLVPGFSFDAVDTELVTDKFPLGTGRADRIEAAVLEAVTNAAYGAIEQNDKGQFVDFSRERVRNLANGCYADLADVSVRGYVSDRVSRMLGLRDGQGNLLLLADDVLDEVLQSLYHQGIIVFDNTYGGKDVYLVSVWRAQEEIVNMLKYRASGDALRFSRMDSAKIDRILKHYKGDDGYGLTKQQQTALYACLTSPVSVLTGGPGTGKSFCIRALAELCQEYSARLTKIYVLAPTGKAVARLNELRFPDTVCRQTVHGFVYENNRLVKNRFNRPVSNAVVIVDETSMLDVLITGRMCRLLGDNVQLIFVGDVDQLPSVQPGELLRNLIDSGVSCGRLVDNLRSGSGSAVVTHSRDIVSGNAAAALVDESGFSVTYTKSDVETVDCVKQTYTNLMSSGADFREIAVITPRSRGNGLVARLNLAKEIAALAIKPLYGNRFPQVDATRNSNSYFDSKGFPISLPAKGKGSKLKPEFIFRVGDRVMNLKNDHDTSRVAYRNGDVEGEIAGRGDCYIANGDVGTIIRYYPDYKEKDDDFDKDGVSMVMIMLDDSSICEIPVSKLYNQWQVAWSMSVHKSQGSEYDHVIVALPTSCPVGLTERSLLYTAVTRARRDVAIIGNMDTILKCISNSRHARPSRLGQML